ncbi:type II toxin-antitoxin system HicB family antitoxin [Desulfarculus baarsii]
MELKYPIEIARLPVEDGGGWLVTFPDLPGCMADGATVEEALREAEDALEAYVKTAQEFGDALPAASVPYSGQFRIRVPKSLHATLAARAKAEGVSLNTMAVAILAEGLGRRSAGASK